jgi:hypothetical protein
VSALAIVCKSDSVEILTDSLVVSVDDGSVVALSSKQAFVGTGGVIAHVGWALPGALFAAAFEDRCPDFDELVDHAPDTWRELDAKMRADFPSDCFRHDPYFYMVAIAGWSHKRGRSEAYKLCSDSFGAIDQTIITFGGGPDCFTNQAEFIRRFNPQREQFDARRDGLLLFEAMRSAPLMLGGGPCRTVGGSVQHTVVNATGIQDAIIHTWDDDTATCAGGEGVVIP